MSSAEYRVWLPFPPSVNNLFSQNRAGRRFPSKRYTAWRREAGWALKASKVQPIAGRFSVCLWLTPPTAHRRDADNYFKGVLDLLVSQGIVADDSLAVSVTAKWDLTAERTGALVELRPA